MSKLVEEEKIEELKELGGDEFIEEIFTLFLSQSEEIYKEIKMAIETKNLDMLYKAGHKLKGSCLNVGTNKLADISKTLELKGKQNDLSDLDSLFVEFTSTYDETVQAVSKYINH
ncbi:MAG: Hpt domain-containing protein [Cyanobacteriota bacterium]